MKGTLRVWTVYGVRYTGYDVCLRQPADDVQFVADHAAYGAAAAGAGQRVHAVPMDDRGVGGIDEAHPCPVGRA